jgi:hypothetical protein
MSAPLPNPLPAALEEGTGAARGDGTRSLAAESKRRPRGIVICASPREGGARPTAGGRRVRGRRRNETQTPLPAARGEGIGAARGQGTRVGPRPLSATCGEAITPGHSSAGGGGASIAAGALVTVRR